MIENNIQGVTKAPTSAKHQIENVSIKQPRSSNLELYRIICMMMIVAHHFALQGFAFDGGPLQGNDNSVNGILLILYGAWGKTGINCFLMITGYFMCTSKITLRKFVKLMGQIYFYHIVLYVIFLLTGYEIFSWAKVARILMPVRSFENNFIDCFIGFWLTIPFLNILVQNMTKRQHEILLTLLLSMFTILGSIPSFKVSLNYVWWFGIIYLAASYIRLYPQPIFNRRKFWAMITFICVFFSIASIVLGQKMLSGRVEFAGYFLMSDCNKFFAVTVAVSSFLWFKNLNIKYSKIINSFGAGTFGVLLIHANSEAMRTWLWKDTLDVVEKFYLPFWELMLFCVAVVLGVFCICNLIDQLRIATLEKWFLSWYDKKVSAKADTWVEQKL